MSLNISGSSVHSKISVHVVNLTGYVTPCFIIHFVNISPQSRFFNTQGLF